MPALSHKLADALAEAVQESVSAPFNLEANGSAITVSRSGRVIGTVTAAEIADDIDSRSEPERLASATRAVLSAIQDLIVRSTAEPWPSTKSGALPVPNAEVRETMLRIWFGDPATPAAELPSLDIRKLVDW